MTADELNKYKVGQKIWFIKTFDNYDDPVVESAIVTRKTITAEEKRTWVQVEFRDFESTYRTAPWTTIYRTKKLAEKALDSACREVWEHRLKNCEAAVNNLKANISISQKNLREAEEILAKYQQKLEELKQ